MQGMMSHGLSPSHRSRFWWVALSGTVLLFVVVILLVISGRRRNAIDPLYVGTWTLAFSDGTTQLVTFNSDGTVYANDNQIYRWTGSPSAVHIDSYEQPIVTLSRPGSVVEYVFPDRGHVVLIPKYSSDGKDLSLVGEAVELRR